MTDAAITFGGIATTRKMCARGMELEMALQQALSSQTVPYRIERLRLYLGDDWVFRKVD